MIAQRLAGCVLHSVQCVWLVLQLHAGHPTAANMSTDSDRDHVTRLIKEAEGASMQQQL